MWYVYTIEHYSAIRKEQNPIFSNKMKAFGNYYASSNNLPSKGKSVHWDTFFLNKTTCQHYCSLYIHSNYIIANGIEIIFFPKQNIKLCFYPEENSQEKNNVRL